MTTGRRRGLLRAAAFTACLLPACGYHLVGVGGRLPGGVTRVEVPIFENRTVRSDAARVFTEDFIGRLLASGKVRLAKGDAAEAVVQGVVTSYKREPITFDARQRPLENRLTIVMDIALVSRDGKRVLYGERSIALRYDYPVRPDLQENDRLEEDALRSASKQMSEKLVSLMLEGF